MKLPLFALSFLLLGTVANASTISWSSGKISSSSDIVSAGDTVFAFTFGDSSFASTVNINGVEFQNAGISSATSDAKFTYLANGNKFNIKRVGDGAINIVNDSSNTMDNGLLTGDYRTLLQSGITTTGADSVTYGFNFTGLLAGHTYVCQIWTNQAHENYGEDLITFSNGSDEADTGSIDVFRGNKDANLLGSWVTATFVADASTQSINMTGGSWMKINAVQLRSLGDIPVIPEPSTATLGLIALTALGMRRKRA